MEQRITREGLKKNRGREAWTNFHGRRYEGVLVYGPPREEVVLKDGAMRVPMRTNSFVCIENHRYHPGRQIWRTYKISK